MAGRTIIRSIQAGAGRGEIRGALTSSRVSPATQNGEVIPFLPPPHTYTAGMAMILRGVI